MMRPSGLPAFQAAIFDMDGLMLDTERLSRDIFQQTVLELGIAVSEHTYAHMIGRTWEDSKHVLLDDFGPEFALDAFRQHWMQNTYNHIEEFGIPIKPGLLELLDLLERRRIPKAVATSTDRNSAASLLGKARLKDRFAAMACGDEVTNGKPAPDIFLLAAERLGVAPAQCVVFEDSAPGIRAAHAAGMVPILVPDLISPAEDTRSLAYQVCDSLHDACILF